MALALGYVNIDLMLDGITAEQLLDWQDYYNIEPFGYDMKNYRSGIVASAVLNSVRQNNSDKTWTYKDFFIENQAREEKQTWEEQLSIANQICSVFGRKEKK